MKTIPELKCEHYEATISTVRDMIDGVVATMDLDVQQAKALSLISNALLTAPFYAAKFAENSQRSVRASEPERSHVGPIL